MLLVYYVLSQRKQYRPLYYQIEYTRKNGKIYFSIRIKSNSKKRNKIPNVLEWWKEEEEEGQKTK